MPHLLAQAPEELEALVRWLGSDERVVDLARVIVPFTTPNHSTAGRLTAMRRDRNVEPEDWSAVLRIMMSSVQMRMYPCYKPSDAGEGDHDIRIKIGRIFLMLANSRVPAHRLLLLDIWLALDTLREP
ncbi:hypothetical protein CO057_04160 [Candidatus Uhrbacteria bacterium CG_4_9_14_0_2_um_filter_41_50]|uniref:Uncharacterized protein n=1 Tax=Candidatus Uhrbacteria bacterium CG_4_9_14_0_2_um_filter_41_50 TaxID=1975031 RepID=A0A2M8EN78_9BACT|nr:MAG: hypothetical protein COY24_04640 [Candidatus Uhrbacteria bacterium CG_4_10_14_0_2_um_filter_41_21]PJC24196.1 MAG: hypothetical protein CO057_04160 [Candidatus Uhrbacteria bacterium CG_4_9_14_0_2_um_filter_41_50]PJE74653.1 MAG: hypothetical protein COV03_04410 [Candidatus Uhrbacteria bacterium CG10_big_fil_rev_8_21_14_0_10_41_26]